MGSENLFITGAAGCLGHYVTEALGDLPDSRLHLLLREHRPPRPEPVPPGSVAVRGDLMEIEKHGELLKTMHRVVHLATAWGGDDRAFDVNLHATLRFLDLLDFSVCRQVILFSTASVLDFGHRLLPEAGTLGTGYIRSKYELVRALESHPHRDRITILHPTLVLGGGGGRPRSHFSRLLEKMEKRLKLIRFFRADASFHFIHAADAARVVRALVENPPQEPARTLVLGNPAITVDQAVAALCRSRGLRPVQKIPASLPLARSLAPFFGGALSDWDRFCMQYRHFTHRDPKSPASFGLETRFPNFSSAVAGEAP